MISYFFKKIKTINFQKYQRSHYIENESNKISSRKDLNAMIIPTNYYGRCLCMFVFL